MDLTPKSQSVTQDGEPDGWEPPAGYTREVDHAGGTRVSVSVPTAFLARVHADLVRAMAPPLGFLYRQVVDRQNPKPQGAPPRDWVGLDLPADAVVEALTACAPLVYHDARCEIWVRGALREQVILDADGMIYCYPDDPAFLDVILGHGLEADPPQTILERDYARHWYHAGNDALEGELVRRLRLVEVPSRG